MRLITLSRPRRITTHPGLYVSGDALEADLILNLPKLKVHAQARLRIVAALAVIPAGDEIVFPRLRELLSMTAGNLSTHLSKLEAAGYVSQSKTFSGRTPATYIALTPRGFTPLYCMYR